ncbi:MAG: Gfo/Idh/MocA family oxidoreductase [Alphaproteobacteria bacterium]|nr:Gfo/Idh/MocA family oxidoreductase [Alphaproteobacteria bacterium]
MLYDPPAPDENDQPQSHALAIARHPEFVLAGLVDADATRREEAQRRFPGSLVFADGRTAFAETQPDLVVIATPTAQHLPSVEEALACGARHVFCEKPLAENAAEAERIAAACRSADVGLTVNYSRRWSRSIAAAQARVASGAFGPPQLITGYYRGALANNGAHLLDLALWFGGPLALEHSLESGDPRAPHLVLRGDGGLQVWLHPLPEGGLDLFELDVICARGRVRLTDGGHRVKMHGGETTDIGTSRYLMPTAPKELTDDSAEALWCAYDDLERLIGQGWADTPALENAFQVSELIEMAAPNAGKTSRIRVREKDPAWQEASGLSKSQIPVRKAT